MRRKKKEIAAIFLAGLIAAAAALTAFGADSEVTYEGGAEKFVFVPGDGNLFPNFNGVMPGDSLSQKITVRNTVNASGGVNLYLRAEGTEETAEGFLEQMTLTVRQGDRLLSEDTGGRSGGLTENVLLGHFSGKGEVELEVTLHVPIEMDNRFQDAEGKLNWVFTAEELDSQIVPPDEGGSGPGGEPGGGSGGSGGGGETGGGPGGSGEGSEPGGGSGGDGSGNGAEAESGLTQIGEEEAPLAGILPEGLAELIPQPILDVMVPLGLVPETGDKAAPGLWIFLLILSGGTLAVLTAVRKNGSE